MEGGIGMNALVLNDNVIEKIKKEIPELVCNLMKDDLVEVILYGSCARGDYTEDSDIDWNKPIPNIDKQLYKKYNLTKEEIEFIEKMIKPM